MIRYSLKISKDRIEPWVIDGNKQEHDAKKVFNAFRNYGVKEIINPENQDYVIFITYH